MTQTSCNGPFQQRILELIRLLDWPSARTSRDLRAELKRRATANGRDKSRDDAPSRKSRLLIRYAQVTGTEDVAKVLPNRGEDGRPRLNGDIHIRHCYVEADLDLSGLVIYGDLVLEDCDIGLEGDRKALDLSNTEITGQLTLNGVQAASVKLNGLKAASLDALPTFNPSNGGFHVRHFDVKRNVEIKNAEFEDRVRLDGASIDGTLDLSGSRMRRFSMEATLPRPRVCAGSPDPWKPLIEEMQPERRTASQSENWLVRPKVKNIKATECAETGNGGSSRANGKKKHKTVIKDNVALFGLSAGSENGHDAAIDFDGARIGGSVVMVAHDEAKVLLDALHIDGLKPPPELEAALQKKLKHAKKKTLNWLKTDFKGGVKGPPKLLLEHRFARSSQPDRNERFGKGSSSGDRAPALSLPLLISIRLLRAKGGEVPEPIRQPRVYWKQELDLSGRTIRGDVDLSEGELSGGLNLEGTTIEGDLVLERASLDFLKMKRARVHGDVNLRGAKVTSWIDSAQPVSVDLDQTLIDGDLLLDPAQADDGPQPFVAEECVRLRGATIKRGIKLDGAELRGSETALLMRHTTVRGPIDALPQGVFRTQKGTQNNELKIHRFRAFGHVLLIGCEFEARLRLDGAFIRGALRIDLSKIRRFSFEATLPRPYAQAADRAAYWTELAKTIERWNKRETPKAHTDPEWWVRPMAKAVVAYGATVRGDVDLRGVYLHHQDISPPVERTGPDGETGGDEGDRNRGEVRTWLPRETSGNLDLTRTVVEGAMRLGSPDLPIGLLDSLKRSGSAPTWAVGVRLSETWRNPQARRQLEGLIGGSVLAPGGSTGGSVLLTGIDVVGTINLADREIGRDVVCAHPTKGPWAPSNGGPFPPTRAGSVDLSGVTVQGEVNLADLRVHTDTPVQHGGVLSMARAEVGDCVTLPGARPQDAPEGENGEGDTERKAESPKACPQDASEGENGEGDTVPEVQKRADLHGVTAGRLRVSEKSVHAKPSHADKADVSPLEGHQWLGPVIQQVWIVISALLVLGSGSRLLWHEAQPTARLIFVGTVLVAVGIIKSLVGYLKAHWRCRKGNDSKKKTSQQDDSKKKEREQEDVAKQHRWQDLQQVAQSLVKITFVSAPIVFVFVFVVAGRVDDVDWKWRNLIPQLSAFFCDWILGNLIPQLSAFFFCAPIDDFGSWLTIAALWMFFCVIVGFWLPMLLSRCGSIFSWFKSTRGRSGQQRDDDAKRPTGPPKLDLRDARIRHMDLVDGLLPYGVNLKEFDGNLWTHKGAMKEIDFPRLLERTSSFQLSNYVGVERILRNQGEQVAADRVRRAMRRREQRKDHRDLRTAWLLLQSLIGYGTRKQTLVGLMIVWFAYSTLVFSVLWGVEPREERLQHFGLRVDVQASLEGRDNQNVVKLRQRLGLREQAPHPVKRVLLGAGLAVRVHVPVISLGSVDGVVTTGGLKHYAKLTQLIHWILWPLLLASLVQELIPRRE